MATQGLIQDSISDGANGVKQQLFSIGTRCWVRVGNDANSAKKVGFIDSMQATKQIQLQRAQVCGAVMPASLDPQAISVNLSLSGFLAVPSVYKSNEKINGLGEVSIASFNPKSSDFMEGSVAVKFPYMDFYDTKTEQILCWVKGAISTNYSVNVQGGSYGKASISMEALDMSSGEDYMDSSN